MRASPLRRSLLSAVFLAPVVFVLSCGGDGGSPSPTPTDLVVTPGSDTLLALGETQAFVASVLDANGDPIDGATVTWSSTAPTVVSVDPNTGVATAVANGAAQVQAHSGSLLGTSPITVAQVPTTITVTPATANFTFVGDTQTFTVTVLDAGGAPVIPVQKVWTLNDNTVAVIDSNGFARAKGPGIAMVTVVAIGPGGAKAGYAAVSSTQPVASLHLRNQPTIAVAGDAIEPAIQVDVRDSGGAVVTGFDGAITIGVDSGPDGAVLRGTRVVNAVNGVATFSGLSFDRIGYHRLSATADSAAMVLAAPINVYPGFPDHVKLLTHPGLFGGAVAGDQIPITAIIVDRLGNFRPDSQDFVTLVLESSLPGGVLSGSNAGVWNSAGYYEFPGAYLQKAQTSYVLKVFTPGVTPAITDPFAVLPGAPYKIVLLGDSGIRVGSAIGSPATTIRTVDQFGSSTIADTLQVVLTAWWAFAAPAGKGQMVIPSDTQVVIGEAPLGPVYLTRPGPTQIIASGPGLLPDSGAIQVANFWQGQDPTIGGAHVCFNVHYCAGANDHGELGVDPLLLTEDSVFVRADSLTNDFGPMAMGTTSACAIDYILPSFTPTVMCRGANDEGQLGLGATGPDEEQWRRIPGATGWWQVALGTAHACALTADSTAVCWGRNDHGQLGRASTTPFEASPAAVNGGTKYQALAAGAAHTCGITLAGGIECWGRNDSGQLGDSTTNESNVPVTVVDTLHYSLITAGEAFTCAVRANVGVKVYCWGANDVGQLGDPSAGSSRSYPGVVSGGLNDLPFRLAAGRAHACALANSALICWGDDSRGQIGNGAGSAPVTTPYGKAMPGSPLLVGLAVGGDQTCTVGYFSATLRNTLFCWGANDRGQLGVGSTADVDALGEPWQ